MAGQVASVRRAILALFLLLGAPAALAVPIEVSFYANDGSAYGEFAFERRPTYQSRGALTSGRIWIADRMVEAPQLFYEFSPIGDSLAVFIRADEESGLDAGDFLNLRFGNPEDAVLVFPTRGSLTYEFGGIRNSVNGTVTPVPEPLAAGLFGLGAAALVWRRRRGAIPRG
jgi:hypothetical protein